LHGISQPKYEDLKQWKNMTTIMKNVVSQGIGTFNERTIKENVLIGGDKKDEAITALNLATKQKFLAKSKLESTVFRPTFCLSF